MLDGVKLYIPSIDFPTLKAVSGIPFATLINIDTGEIKCRITNSNGQNSKRTITHRGEFETYTLTVKEIESTQNGRPIETRYTLEINGSFHKNCFGGKNVERFTWANLQGEIAKLCDKLGIGLSETQVQNLEFGVNIPVDFKPLQFLDKNILSYKGAKPFGQYEPDSKGMVIGYHCNMDEYTVKIYDKGKQQGKFAEVENRGLMRFELRYTTMRELKDNHGISTLQDLTNFGKVNSLLPRLMKAWENVYLKDNTIQTDLMKPRDREFYQKAILNGCRWGKGDHESKRKFSRITTKYGSSLKANLSESIRQQWGKAMEIPEIPPGVIGSLATNQNTPKNEFFRNPVTSIKGGKSEKRFLGSYRNRGKVMTGIRSLQ